MWTLKSAKSELNLEAKVPGERLMLHVEAILENKATNKEVTIPFTAENKDIMDRTLLSLPVRMNQAETDNAATPSEHTKYTPVEPVKPAPVEPTKEEVFENRKQEIRGKLAALKEEVNLGLAEESDYAAALTKAKTWLTKNKK